MKILNFVSSLDVYAGGPTQSIRNQLNYLALYYPNDRFILYTKKSKSQLDEKLFNKNIKVVFFKNNFELVDAFIKGKFDLVHFHGIWELSINLLMLASRIMNIPYIVSPRGMLESWALKQGKFKKHLALVTYQKSNLKSALLLHATSRMEENSFRNLNFKNKVEVIPNGIDLSQINIFNNLKKDNTFIFISRLHPKKGVELLIEAFSKIDKKLSSSWKVDIYGDGKQEYVQSLKLLIKSKYLESNINIHKSIWSEKKFFILQNSKYLVLPSFSENFGNIVAEALACGIPVITSKNTPWIDLINYNCGWYIDNDVNSLTATLTNAIMLPAEIYAEMAFNARKLVEEKYDSKIMAEQFYNLYTQFRTDL